MRVTLVVVFLVGSLLEFGTSRALDLPPTPPFRALYLVDVKDNPKGVMEITVNFDATARTYAIELAFGSDKRSVQGMISGSKTRILARLVEGKLQLVDARATQDVSRHHYELIEVLDWQKGVATVTMNGKTSQKPFRGEHSAGFRQELVSAFYAATVWVPGDYELAELSSSVRRTEGEDADIHTAMGEYRARRLDLEQPSGDRATFWIAPDLNGLPIKVEFPDGRRSVAFVLAELHEGVELSP